MFLKTVLNRNMFSKKLERFCQQIMSHLEKVSADYVAPGKNQTELQSGFGIDNNRGFGFGIPLGSKMT
jgi:hypothetical protein